MQARARALRHPQTPTEVRLWARLRDRRLGGYKFRRQVPIGPFVVDFICTACNLVLEVDGQTHNDQIAYDEERTAWLQAQGYHVLRITNADVQNNLDAVLQLIIDTCQRFDSALHSRA